MQKQKIFIDYKSQNKSCITVDERDLIKDCVFINEDKLSRKSNIYLATVSRIEGSLEAAFINYGEDKSGFLPFKEIHPNYYQISSKEKQEIESELEKIKEVDDYKEIKEETLEINEEVDEILDQKEKYKKLYQKYKIQDVIKKGQTLLVQVFKDERSNKGASLTTYISIPGRCFVYMPNSSNGLSISRKISQYDKRRKIFSILKKLDISESESLIVRTVAKDATIEDFKNDFHYLKGVWSDIGSKIVESNAPCEIYTEIDEIKQTIRDNYNAKTIESVLINDVAYFQSVKTFISKLIPGEEKKVRLYKEEDTKMYQKYNIERKVKELLGRVVHLKSGGYLVIDSTEALTAIDVNSGKAISEKDVEETALNINLEAAEEVAKQMKLRGLGGLIVVDFIDMMSAENRRRLEDAMREFCSQDRAKIQFTKLSIFGLMEISRQRLKNSLSEVLEHDCVYCNRTGKVQNESVLSTSLLHEIESLLNSLKRKKEIAKNDKLNITASEDVCRYILKNEKDVLKKLEKEFNIEMVFEPIKPFSFDHYQINLLKNKNGDVLSIELASEKLFNQNKKLTKDNLIKKILKFFKLTK